MAMLPRYVMVQCAVCHQLLRVPQMVEPTLDGDLLVRLGNPHRCPLVRRRND